MAAEMQALRRGLVGVGFVVAAACGGQQSSSPLPPAPAAPAPGAVVAVPTESAGPAPSAHPEGTRSSAEARVACGESSCPAATQVCCGHVPAERGTCLDYAGDRTDIGAVGRACASLDDQHYPLVCDDSGDCPPAHTCCDELGGDPDYHVCTPLRADGWHACNGFEVCGAHAPCRSAGTRCERGVCELPRPDPIAVRCHGRTCAGATPVCCAVPGSPSCVEDARDCPEQIPVMHCSGPKSCAAHETCLFYPPTTHPGWTTSCSQWSGGGNLAIVCEADADCANLGGMRLVCRPNADFSDLFTCAGP